MPHYSLFQDGDYLATGLNSKTKEEAVNEGVEFIIGEDNEFSSAEQKKIRKMTLEDKELFLAWCRDIVVEEHEKLIEEGE